MIGFVGPAKDPAAMRTLAQECNGARKSEFIESRKRAGITKERVFLAETPMGPMVCAYGEGLNAGFQMARFAASANAFDRHFIESLVKAARNYYLATTRPEGGPHMMVVWGLWEGDTFQFSTGKTSRKARNLAADPRCVVCADAADGGEEAVIVEGVARELAGDDARRRFFAAYEAKYAMDVSTMGEPLYVVVPRRVFGQIEKTFTQSATRWDWGPAPPSKE